MYIEFFILMFVCISISSSQQNENMDNVLYAKKFQSRRNRISDTKHHSFYDFLQVTDILVDKSLLLKELLMNQRNTRRTILITAPRRFGKSTNLKMLEFFLQPEQNNESIVLQKETKSYKFFMEGKIITKKGRIKELNNPPAISKYADLVEKYSAKFPVIYLDFFKINAMFGYTDFIKAFRRILADIFKKYDTAVKNLCQYKINAYKERVAESSCFHKDYEEFIKIRSRKEKNTTPLVDSFLSLSRLLKEYYGKPVVVLIDEYDCIITKLYAIDALVIQEKDKHLVGDFLAKFLERTFTTNENILLGVLTGIFPFVLNFNGGLMEIQYFTHASKEFHPYYGFSIGEVEQLSRIINIPKEMIQEAYSVYNGYCVNDDSHKQLYDCLSITKFLNSRKIDYYWTVDDTAHYQKVGTDWLPKDIYYVRERIFQHPQNEEIVAELLIDKCVPHSPIRQLEINELGQMELLLRTRGLFHKFVVFAVSLTDLSFWFMNAAGYLTMVDYANGSYCSKIANDERRAQISSFFFEMKSNHELEIPSINALQNMMCNPAENPHSFLKEYKKMIVKYSAYKVFATYKNLILFQTEILRIVKRTAMIHGYNFTANLPLNNSDTVHPYPHLVIFNETRAVIFEIKFHSNNEKSREIIDQQILPCCRVFFKNNPKIECLTIVLVNIRLKNRDILFKHFTYASFSDIPKNTSMTYDVDLIPVFGIASKLRTFKPKKGGIV